MLEEVRETLDQVRRTPPTRTWHLSCKISHKVPLERIGTDTVEERRE
jgi:hypothetical protein